MRIFSATSSLLLASALFVTCIMTSVVAHAQNNDEEARVHFRLGTAYYDSGRFSQAAQEFKQAYELSRRPQLLYNLFLAYRDAGEIANAAGALRQFLAEEPDIEDRGKLEARLAALEKILAEQPPEQQKPADEPPAAQAPAAEAQPETKAAEPAAASAASEPKLKWLPWTLIGTGGALVVGGVISGTLAVSDQKKLENDCPNAEECTLSKSEVNDLKSSGSTKAALGDALWITGAVTAGVGIAFLFWQPWNKGDASSASLDFDCRRSGCRAAYTGRF